MTQLSLARRLLDEAARARWDVAARMFLPWIQGHPGRLGRIAGLLWALHRSDRRRQRMASRYGVPIPITLVISPSLRCNLACPSCGAKDRPGGTSELSPQALKGVLAECRTLGIGRLVLIGGEPLLRADLDEVVGSHPDLLFFIFTNGRLLSDERACRFASFANLVLLVNASSGSCRGSALDPLVVDAFRRMERHGLLYGCSATVTTANQAAFSSPGTLETLRALGCRCGVFFNYLPPFGSNGDPLALDPVARRRFVARVRAFCRERGFFALFAPEDEQLLGGCVAAGREVMHVAASGAIEPCPFVPLSPFRFPEHTLLEALTSSYFRELRGELGSSTNSAGSCRYREAEARFLALAARHGANHLPC